MEITDVIRGEDHLSNTPKHILLFRALGHAVPRFAHLPLILNPDRTKMSKRKSQTAIDDYIAQGFVKEALVNYLALLGWSTGTEEEILSLDEIVERFDIERRPQGRRGLRSRATRVAERPVDPPASRPTTSSTDCDRSSRPSWPPGASSGCRPTTSCARCCRSSRSACRRSARSATWSGSCGSPTWTLDAGDAGPQALGRRDDARGTERGARHDRGGRRRVVRGRRARAAASGRWPRSAAGRRATCSWRSAWPSPAGPRRRRCSTRSSRSAASASSPASTGPLGGARASMTRDDVQAWLDRYIAAWAADDAAAIGDLFTDGRALSLPPVRRWASSGAMRSSGPGSNRRATRAHATSRAPGRPTTSRSPSTAIGRSPWAGAATTRTRRVDGQDLWDNVYLLEFGDDGRCRAFTESFVERPDDRR